MKPRSKPGRVITNGRTVRAIMATAKPLSENQMEYLKRMAPQNFYSGKAGMGGKRASWDTDYEEGCRCHSRNMPYRENEGISMDGMRRFPKKGHS